MVNVEWDFEGGEVDRTAAEQAVGKVVSYYTLALAGIICPVHQQEPSLKVSGRTLNGLGVSIETCCQILLQQTEARIGGISRRDQG